MRIVECAVSEDSRSVNLNKARSGPESVPAGGEVLGAFLHFSDLFALLVSGELASEGAGELGPEELGALDGSSVEGACSGGAFLLVEDGEVASDVSSYALDLGELRSASRGGLRVTESSQLLLEFVDVGADGLGVAVSDLLADLLFHHSRLINIKNQYFNLLIITKQNGQDVRFVLCSFKSGRVVIFTQGRFAGKKAVVIKAYEEGNKVRVALRRSTDSPTYWWPASPGTCPLSSAVTARRSSSRRPASSPSSST